MLFAAMTAPVVVPATYAEATITSSFDDGVLAIASDDDPDEIVVRCSDTGEVRISHARPDTGSVLCADVTAISIVAGGGNDDVDVTHVGDGFVSLVSVTVDSGTGNDVITGSPVADSILAGEGNDRIEAALDDTIDAGEGTDRLKAVFSGVATISDATVPSVEILTLSGSDGDDVVDGTGYSSRITINVRDGDDIVLGGTGSNILEGGDGDDTLTGGPAHDVIAGAGGNDVGTGLAGNDVFDGFSDGTSVADGGAGNDRFSLFYPSRGSRTLGGAGSDRIEVLLYGSVRLADDSIRWDEGRTTLAEIERATIIQIDTSVPVTLDATRFSGSTWLYGGPADDVLLGGSGPDHLYGVWGNDTLQGGGGADLLDGSRGRDTCDGGRGRDRTRDCEREI